jgi:peroxiredoxin
MDGRLAPEVSTASSPRAKHRTVVTAAAVAAILLGGALTASLLTTGGSSTGRVVDGNAVEYTAGHRPLVPGLTATSLTGKTIKMSSYQGEIVVLNFWESSCAPCRAEAPALEAAYQQYQPRGVDFLGDDVGDTPVNALAFVHSEGISYPSVNDPDYAFVQQFSRTAQAEFDQLAGVRSEVIPIP